MQSALLPKDLKKSGVWWHTIHIACYWLNNDASSFLPMLIKIFFDSLNVVIRKDMS